MRSTARLPRNVQLASKCLRVSANPETVEIVKSRSAWAILKSWYAHNMAHNEITVGERGRVVLPSAVRRQLDLKPGTHMLLSTEDDGSLRLRSYRAVAEQSRGLLRRLPGGSMVDDLLAERRAEADREDTE
jgi:AbrB family looped-hinge helix DNA binding protein